jgi:uncharacterized iron-regulated membrane protein
MDGAVMKFRNVLFWTHLTLGVTAGLFIFSSAVTGMMLAFEPYIVEWSEEDVRYVSPPENATRLSLDLLAEKAQQSKSKGNVSAITIKSDPRASAVVGFGREGSLYINPYTGDVLGGTSKTHKFLHFIEDWHRWLVKRDIGKPIIGASTFAFFILVLSGIYIWWPKSWTVNKLKSITFFNFTLTGKARDWNWHNVIGFWCCIFLLVTTSTGLIMSYQWANNLLFRITGNTPPPPANSPMDKSATKKENSPAPERASWDTLWSTVQQKTTDEWASINIRLPQKAGGTVTATIQEVEVGPGIGRRSQLNMDAATGEVTKWEPFTSLNSGRKARMWARYLHTGEAAGLIGQIVMFLSACGATFLVWTGISMSWHRFRNKSI